MLNTIITAIFKVIAKIGDIILIPITTLLSGIIPNFSNFYNAILNFIDYSFTYFLFFIKLLGIPQVCLQAVLTVALATLTITISVRVYVLIVNIYNKFKP